MTKNKLKQAKLLSKAKTQFFANSILAHLNQNVFKEYAKMVV